MRIFCMCLCLIVWGLSGCAGEPAPQVRYYKVAVEAPAQMKQGGLALGVESLSADATYDDARIVYRTSPYRVDYYYYHRWSAPPAVMMTDALRQSLWSSGQFGRVVAGSSGVDGVLRGRLLALEEVDGEEGWRGRLVMELVLDRGGEVVWSGLIHEEERLKREHPEALAEAVSVMLERAAAQLAPKLSAALAEASR